MRDRPLVGLWQRRFSAVLGWSMTPENRPSVDDIAALGDRIAESAALIDSALHRLLADIRRFDECEGWHQQGALSCAAWLQWRVGIALGAAREKVRVARALGRFAL